MFSDDLLTPRPQLSGCDREEEAVVYCKILIKAGLDPDTKAPAGMRQRLFSNVQHSTQNVFQSSVTHTKI